LQGTHLGAEVTTGGSKLLPQSSNGSDIEPPYKLEGIKYATKKIFSENMVCVRAGTEILSEQSTVVAN
jgi:hypothetical protein